MLGFTPAQSPNSRSRISEEAALDAVATERLKSNSRPHIGVLLQPLAPGLAQFIHETSRDCDFMERVKEDEPGVNTDELFNRWPGYSAFFFPTRSWFKSIFKSVKMKSLSFLHSAENGRDTCVTSPAASCWRCGGSTATC